MKKVFFLKISVYISMSFRKYEHAARIICHLHITTKGTAALLNPGGDIMTLLKNYFPL